MTFSYFSIFGMHIREAEPQDNPHLAAIIRTVFEEHAAPRQGTVYSDPTTDQLFELFEKETNCKLFVAVVDNKIVGLCGIYPTKDLPPGYAELVKFYLLPEARGQGIGKALMKKCVDTATGYRYTHLYLESLPEFSRAIKMYEALGFKSITAPLGLSGHTSCSIWMVKALDVNR